MNYLICVGVSDGKWAEICGYVTSEEVAKEFVDAMHILNHNDESERYYYKEDEENISESEYFQLVNIEYRLELARERINNMRE